MCIGNIGDINRGVPITDIKLTIYATTIFTLHEILCGMGVSEIVT